MTSYPNPHKVEVLAPAGSRDALIGAFSAGADAVYLGGERFGARAYADNFSTEDIIRSIGEAHVLDRKVYLTANVLTREDEMQELVSFVRQLDEAGLDGVIVQDLGVLAALHEACPGLPLHASTQLSVTGQDAVRLLRDLGVSRVVPARELSLLEIEALRAEDAAMYSEPVEIEAFVHGAMCYSYSGRCLMSSFLGGRSGNRGRCAGTCRLPYRILDEKRKPAGPDARRKEVYPLSMKDMCVLSILPELIDAGIDSFKIEGRMKKPVYAAGVTAIYRKYVDRFYAWSEAGRPTPWKVEEEDLEKLRSLYIRTDLGTGYYHTANGRNLVTIGKPGYAGTDAVLEEEIRRKYLGRLPARPVRGKAVFRIGEPAGLSVMLSGQSGQEEAAAEASGAVVQTAAGRPLTREDLLARLSRTGDTMFTFSDLEIEADDNIFLPVSAVNTLRRQALSLLQEEILRAARSRRVQKAEAASAVKTDPAPQEPAHSASEDQDSMTCQELWAVVSTEEQMDAAARTGCSCILIDGDFDPPAGVFSAKKTQKGNISGVQLEKTGKIVPEKIRYICALPPVFRVNYRDRIRQDILSAPEKGYSGILVRTLEELSLVLQTGYEGEIIADASLYRWNGRSLSILLRNCGRVVCPLELNQTGIREAVRAAGREAAEGQDAVMKKMILPVYGRIPMMESAGCVRKTENLCSKKDGFCYLEDRRGMQLPVRCRCTICANTIYNAVPLSLHQAAGRGLYREVSVHLCMFTTEDAEQTGKILRFFGSLQSPGQTAADHPRNISGMIAEKNRENHSASASGRKNAGATGKNKGKNTGKKTRGGRAAEARSQASPPFEQFTNGHYKTGAI